MPVEKRRQRSRKKITEVFLTITGTAVVAITFFVHEVKRENVKELKDGIAQVQEETLIRDDIRALGVEVSVIKERLARPQPPIKTDDYLWESFADSVTERKIIRQSTKTSLSNVTLLVLSLEEPKDYALRIQQITSEEKTLAQKDEEQMGQIFAGKLKSHQIQSPSQQKEISQQIGYVTNQDQEITKEFTKFSNEQAALVKDVTTDATQTADKAKRSYERYTHLSYFLYSLGFILGLVGKMIGIEGVAEEE